jgi:hypothetical protein
LNDSKDIDGNDDGDNDGVWVSECCSKKSVVVMLVMLKMLVTQYTVYRSSAEQDAAPVNLST